MWNTITGEIVDQFRGHGKPINHFVKSWDDQFLYSCSNDNRVIKWNTVTGELVDEFSVCKNVSTCILNEKYNHLYFGVESGAVKVWDFET